MKITKTKLREIIKQEIHKLDEGATPLKLPSIKRWTKQIDNQLSDFLFDGFDGWEELEDAMEKAPSGTDLDNRFEKFQDTVYREMMAGLIKALKKSY